MPIGLEQMRTNRILAGLPVEERDLIVSSLESNELYLGDVIANAGKPIQRLYFPLDSAISIVNEQEKPNDKHIVEVTVIGKEGCSGATVVQGSDTSPSVALVQIGGTAGCPHHLSLAIPLVCHIFGRPCPAAVYFSIAIP